MHRYVGSPFLTYAGLSYNDISAGITYAFSISTGKLTQIASILDNSSIVVEYHGQEYPVLFAHSNGKSLNISYADSGLISYVDLLDEENIIEKTRSVMCVCALHMNGLKFSNLSNVLFPKPRNVLKYGFGLLCKDLSCGVLSVENRSMFLLSVAMGKIALTQTPQMKLQNTD